jgi:hypothetical protein
MGGIDFGCAVTRFSGWLQATGRQRGPPRGSLPSSPTPIVRLIQPIGGCRGGIGVGVARSCAGLCRSARSGPATRTRDDPADVSKSAACSPQPPPRHTRPATPIAGRAGPAVTRPAYDGSTSAPDSPETPRSSWSASKLRLAYQPHSPATAPSSDGGPTPAGARRQQCGRAGDGVRACRALRIRPRPALPGCTVQQRRRPGRAAAMIIALTRAPPFATARSDGPGGV